MCSRAGCPNPSCNIEIPLNSPRPFDRSPDPASSTRCRNSLRCLSCCNRPPVPQVARNGLQTPQEGGIEDPQFTSPRSIASLRISSNSSRVNDSWLCTRHLCHISPVSKVDAGKPGGKGRLKSQRKVWHGQGRFASVSVCLWVSSLHGCWLFVRNHASLHG